MSLDLNFDTGQISPGVAPSLQSLIWETPHLKKKKKMGNQDFQTLSYQNITIITNI